MRISLYKKGIAAAILGMLGTSAVWGATPAVDMGALKSAGETISVTVALKLSDQAGAEALMQRLAMSSDALYGNFLTPGQVEAQFGPRDADVQAAWQGVVAVKREDLQPGDLLFFGGAADRITHTGMYIGEGKFINATTWIRPVVQICNLGDPHWTRLLVACRRLK